MSPSFASLLLIALPTLPLLAGLLARRQKPAPAGKIAWTAAAISAGLAVLAGVWLWRNGPETIRWAPFGADAAFAVALRLDVLAVVMVTLVTYLGQVVLGFSRKYLAGDPGYSRFISWMSLTLASVVLLVLAAHLLLLLVAWVSTSLCLHRLLLHFPHRTGAVFSARKKFVISRLGDACMLGAAFLLYRQHHTFDLERILANVAAGHGVDVNIAALLLAACAMLKSAQFPFHSWLPDTMETPTPVSAFMHAGIINAGGFLVIRLAPVFAAAPLASHLLALVGGITAGFGAIVMLAQPSIKRALAYSTIAQMGFMILQCGLGAYGLALLHIVAHSLYKAHAFLTSGASVGATPRAAIPLTTSSLTVGALIGGLLVSFGAILAHEFAPQSLPAYALFGVVLASAAAYGFARLWSARATPRAFGRGLAAAGALVALSFGLHSATSLLVPDAPQVDTPPVLLAALGLLFAGLFIFQSLLWRAEHWPLGRRMYVHALNGFYFGTFFNRLLSQLWPRETTTAGAQS